MPSDRTPLRALALGRALGWLAAGLKEEPPGSNWGPDVKRILAAAGINVPAPWCAAFVWAAVEEVCRLHGLPNPLEPVVRRALVLDYHTLAKDEGWLIEPEWAERGDLVIFDFAGNARSWDHIGLVVDPPAEDGSFRSIEGNTNDAGGREGVEVAIKQRTVVPGRTQFARWDAGLSV